MGAHCCASYVGKLTAVFVHERFLGMSIFPRDSQPKGPTSVYVVTCLDRVKIGIAMNVHARVIDLQFVCPFPVAIVAQREFPTRLEAMRAERALHAKFDAERIHGEWFVLAGETAAQALRDLPDSPASVTIRGRLRSRQPGIPHGKNPPHNFAITGETDA